MDNEHPNQESEKWAEAIRAMIMHESNVINQRITWLMTTQGLLFASLGFAWDKKAAMGLVAVFSGIGILTAISSYTVLDLSAKGMRSMVQWWDEHKSSSYVGPDVIGNRTTHRGGLLWLLRPWRALPWIFVIGWVIIAVINFVR